VPTDEGLVWFKAGGPGNAYEAGLLERLRRWAVPYVLPPLAVEVDRGWLLLPDGGTRLRDTLDRGPGLEPWGRILGEWAGLQRQVAPRIEELLAAGVPDRRPAVMPGHLADLLDDPVSQLEPADRERLLAVLPTYVGWCQELDALGIAPSLQHDDLHDGNVFVGPAGDRFFDWGDASVAHPFGTLLVTFRSISSRGLGNGAAERRALIRLRDAYLEPWTDRHARADLAAAVALAIRVAIVGRALSWRGALAGIPPDDHGEWTGNVGGWLMELFEPTPL
jgi:Phosphotransferase enzyme family